MFTWIKQGILKGRGTNGWQIDEKVLNFLGYKIDTNQHNT
jgi:hypothetical protein